MIEFFVAGEVAAKGNMRPFIIRGGGGPPRVRMIEGLRKTKPWLASVAAAAHEAMRGRPLFEGTPLEVEAVFGFARPKSHFGKRGLKDGAPVAPCGPPDLDKLQRAIGDALKGVVYDDDSRIVSWCPTKIYVPPGAPTGAWVRVYDARALHVLKATERYAEASGRGDHVLRAL